MKYRVIEAPGFTGTDNKARVHGYYPSAETAMTRATARNLLAQESLSGGFNPEDEWDWADWAHRGGIDAGLIRNVIPPHRHEAFTSETKQYAHLGRLVTTKVDVCSCGAKRTDDGQWSQEVARG